MTNDIICAGKAGMTANVEETMDFQIGDIIKMKKPHPCGANQWEIMRVGMDFRLKCRGCGHQVMMPRKQVEKGCRGKISPE